MRIKIKIIIICVDINKCSFQLLKQVQLYYHNNLLLITNNKMQNLHYVEITNLSVSKCTLIFLHSFSDYVFLKMLANKMAFTNQIKIKQFQDRRKIFNETVTAVIIPNPNHTDKYQQILAQLIIEDIDFRQGCNLPQELLSFTQFTKRVFGDRRYTLITSRFYFNKEQLQLAQHLFSKNQPFKIHLVGNIKDNCWIINNPQYSTQTQQNQNSQILCKNVFKIGSYLILNAYKFYHKKNQFLAQLQRKNSYMDMQICKLWVTIQNKFNFHLKLKFNNQLHLQQMIYFLCVNRLLDCIEWQEIKQKKKQLLFSDLNSLVNQLRRRKEQEMLNLNLTKQGFKDNQLDSNVFQNQTIQNMNMNNNIIIQLFLDVLQKIRGKKFDIISSLSPFWESIKQAFKQFHKNWKMYFNSQKQVLQKLIAVMEYKYYKFRIKLDKGEYFYFYQYIYDNISFFIKGIHQILQKQCILSQLQKRKKQNKTINEQEFIQERLQKIKRQYKIEDGMLDKLMIDFISELDSIKKGKGAFYVKIEGFQKKHLKQFIAQVVGYQQKVANWQDIFNLITLNTQKIVQNKKKPLDIVKVSNSNYPNLNCLGCTDFFILNQSITGGMNRTPLRVFPDCSLNKFKNEILQQFCYMLNNNGGVILFSVTRQYGSILPKGSYLSERTFQQYESTIQQFIKSIYPQIRLNQDIFISYVPIVKEQQIKKQQRTKLVHITNLYSMRIKVCPKYKSSVFLWKDQDKYKTVSRDMNRKANQIDLYKLNRSIKQKLKKYSDKKNQFRSTSILNHKCKDVVVFADSKKDFSAAFQFISMIVVKQMYINKIQQQLKKLGFDWRIEVKFREHKFSIAKYTAVLYHNNSFEDVLRHLTNNSDLKFEEKRVLAIFVTKYLKIQSSKQFTIDDIKNAAAWLKKQFPDETLTYYQYKNQKNLEHYVTTSQRISNLFMYYVFNHFKLKTIFKDPQSPSQLVQQKIDQLNQGLQVGNQQNDNRNPSESIIKEPIISIDQQKQIDFKQLQTICRREFNQINFA